MRFLCLLILLSLQPTLQAERKSHPTPIQLPEAERFVEPTARDRAEIGEAVSDIELALVHPDRFEFTATCDRASLAPKDGKMQLTVVNYSITWCVDNRNDRRFISITSQPVLADGMPSTDLAGQVRDVGIGFRELKVGDKVWGGFGEADTQLDREKTEHLRKRMQRRGLFFPMRAALGGNCSEIVHGKSTQMSDHSLRKEYLNKIVREGPYVHTLWRFRLAGSDDQYGPLTRYVTFKEGKIVQCEDHLALDPSKRSFYSRTLVNWKDIQVNGQSIAVPVMLVTSEGIGTVCGVGVKNHLVV